MSTNVSYIGPYLNLYQGRTSIVIQITSEVTTPSTQSVERVPQSSSNAALAIKSIRRGDMLMVCRIVVELVCRTVDHM